MSGDFVKCPFCAGHELISVEAAARIAELIIKHIRGSVDTPLMTELFNIRNAILNTEERAAPVDDDAIDPLLL